MRFTVLFFRCSKVECSNSSLITNLISALNSVFAIKDLGDLSYFLGIEVIKQKDSVLLSQQKYIIDLLKRTKMDAAKPVATPLAMNTKISRLGTQRFEDPTLYRSVCGALQYLHLTRLDIAVAVNKVCQFMQDPYIEH
ncbi:uncharacterized protein LOC113316680 [Papaver somniferum]|uniref:uncharacterized protein LOC113316680 n=1 Tax=Papaver somniferum TaxID=3469 RepID=UPI000E703BA3|nr:uncharacterized protein LOC113316680 [Papaver somniferum]